MSASLDPSILLQAYATGIFPMAESRTATELFWVEPRERAILPLDLFHVSRSLARTLRSGRFRVTCNQDFAGVIQGCADRPETWINAEIEDAMLALHRSGHAHSLEVWTGGDEPQLAGGIYGVALGRAFFGESMFSRRTDASKVALAWLVTRLKVGGYMLLDCQFMTDHLASLGAVSLSRDDYVTLLSAAVGGADSGSASAGTGGRGRAGRGLADAPEFAALDGLLDSAGVSDDPAGSGKLITQLLGQTS